MGVFYCPNFFYLWLNANQFYSIHVLSTTKYLKFRIDGNPLQKGGHVID